MVQISAMRFIPSAPKSSSLPTKGDIKVAPALAASNACPAEKHKVTFTIISRAEIYLQTISPALVKGTLIVTCGPIADKTAASASMPSTSVAVTSALTGPSIKSQIAAMVFLISPPDLAINDGLVVTPSIMPVSNKASICFTSAVSRNILMEKNVIALIFRLPHVDSNHGQGD